MTLHNCVGRQGEQQTTYHTNKFLPFCKKLMICDYFVDVKIVSFCKAVWGPGNLYYLWYCNACTFCGAHISLVFIKMHSFIIVLLVVDFMLTYSL